MRQNMTEREAMTVWMSKTTEKHHVDLAAQILTSQHRRRAKRRNRRILMLIVLFVIFLIGASSISRSAKAAQASCYGPGFFGNAMANGQILRYDTVAIASRTIPLGTHLAVKYQGLVVQATVTDRGPYARDSNGNYSRDLDLTQAMAQVYGYIDCRTWGVRSVKTWRVR